MQTLSVTDKVSIISMQGNLILFLMVRLIIFTLNICLNISLWNKE